VLFACLLFLVACSPAATTFPAAATLPAAASYLVTAPYDVPSDGVASWYGPGFVGRHTANGEIYDPGQLTAAHRSLPFNTQVRVTNLVNGMSVVVRINDRGPFKRNRVIDLSRAAAEHIGMLREGTVPVSLELLTGVGGIVPAAEDPGLQGYDVVARGYHLGELLLLSSGRATHPFVVRVIGSEVSAVVGADILLSPELYSALGPTVNVVTD